MNRTRTLFEERKEEIENLYEIIVSLDAQVEVVLVNILNI